MESERNPWPVSMRQLVSALEFAGDAVEINDQTGRILYVNAAFERQTGYSREEAIGRTPAELLRSEQMPVAFFQQIWEAVSNGRTWSGEFVRRRKSGEHFPVEVSISPIRNDKDEVEHFVAISRDITERKAADAERMRLEAQLIQNQKMESLGRLAGGIAHDFNNVLMGIQGFAQFTLESLAMDHEARPDVEDILASVDHAYRLTRPLLAMSRSRSGTLGTVNVDREVRRMVQLLRRTIPAQILIELAPASQNDTLVLGNQSELEQVAMNLIVNARDAIQGKGSIRITVDQCIVNASVSVISGQVPPGTYVQLTVSDDGRGIETENLGRIFEPFFTTRATGNGLGLATTWSVVQKHGGHLDVESEVGTGTTFRVLLPSQSPLTLDADMHGSDDEHKISASRVRILVVEDDARVRVVVERMLEPNGYEVRCVESAPAALDFLDAGAWRPDVMLTDVIMPEMSGAELARIAAQRFPALKILLMTGYSANHLDGPTSDGGDLEVLSKPFSAQELHEAITQCLKGG